MLIIKSKWLIAWVLGLFVNIAVSGPSFAETCDDLLAACENLVSGYHSGGRCDRSPASQPCMDGYTPWQYCDDGFSQFRVCYYACCEGGAFCGGHDNRCGLDCTCPSGLTCLGNSCCPNSQICGSSCCPGECCGGTACVHNANTHICCNNTVVARTVSGATVTASTSPFCNNPGHNNGCTFSDGAGSGTLSNCGCS